MDEYLKYMSDEDLDKFYNSTVKEFYNYILGKEEFILALENLKNGNRAKGFIWSDILKYLYYVVLKFLCEEESLSIVEYLGMYGLKLIEKFFDGIDYSSLHSNEFHLLYSQLHCVIKVKQINSSLATAYDVLDEERNIDILNLFLEHLKVSVDLVESKEKFIEMYNATAEEDIGENETIVTANMIDRYFDCVKSLVKRYDE